MIVKSTLRIKRDIKNILVIQLGDIGDVVWATPALWAVKEKYPNAKISILVREGFGMLLEEDPSLYKIFEAKHYNGGLLHRAIGQLEFLTGLRRERFDFVFDLRAGDRGAILAYITGAPTRVAAFYRDVPFWRNLLFTHLVDPPAPPQRVFGAAEQSLRILRECSIHAKNTVPKLWVSDEVRKQVRQIIDDEKISSVNERWITLNPYSRWQYKEWNNGKWAQIIDWLWDQYQMPVVLLGSQEERARAIELTKKCQGTFFNLAGKTTLGELAGVLSLSYLHLGVDSAAPHIAAAVGTPTITIYGPSDWRDWAPPGAVHRVVTPDNDCAPCHQKGCDSKGWSKCLQDLGIEKVQKSIKEMMETLTTARSA